MRWFAAAIAAFVLSPSAGAAEPVSGALIDRPLLLPAGAIEAQIGWEQLGFRAGGPRQNGVWFAADAGLPAGLQIGVAAAFSEAPDFGFDRAAARGLVSLHRWAALRLDSSVYRFRRSGPAEHGYASGRGFSLRIPTVEGTLALFSGRSFALPPISRTIDEDHFADDLVTLDLNHSNVTATVGVPVGLELQAFEQLALRLRSGFRHGFGGGLYDENWIPIALDAVASFSGVDLLASLELPGNLRAHADVYVAQAVLRATF